MFWACIQMILVYFDHGTKHDSLIYNPLKGFLLFLV